MNYGPSVHAHAIQMYAVDVVDWMGHEGNIALMR